MSVSPDRASAPGSVKRRLQRLETAGEPQCRGLGDVLPLGGGGLVGLLRRVGLGLEHLGRSRGRSPSATGRAPTLRWVFTASMILSLTSRAPFAEAVTASLMALRRTSLCFFAEEKRAPASYRLWRDCRQRCRLRFHDSLHSFGCRHGRHLDEIGLMHALGWYSWLSASSLPPS